MPESIQLMVDRVADLGSKPPALPKASTCYAISAGEGRSYRMTMLVTIDKGDVGGV